MSASMAAGPFGDVRAVLLDVGGTLYVSPEFDALVEDQAYVALARDRGCSVEEAKRLLKAQRDENIERIGDPTKVRALEDLGVRREVFQDAVAALDPSSYLAGAPSIGGFLAGVHSRGVKVGVLSNFKEVLVRHVFDCLGADWESVDASICVEDGLPIKPDLAPFKVLCERLGVEPAEAVFVGDSVSKDLAPAKRLGMRTVLVGNDGSEADAAKVDRTVAAVDRVLDLLPAA